jgi:replicative DNA helicase
MDGSTNPSRELQIDAERKLLVALCQSTLSPETRATILSRLSNHRFAEPDHEVVYRALAAMPAMDHADALQALTQAVTRMGFPDLDLGGLFKEYSLTPDELASLLSRL